MSKLLVESGITPGVRASNNVKMKVKLLESVWGYFFIFPWLIGFFVLTFWPMIESLYLSFTHYNLLQPARWTGLQNYRELFTNDDMFAQSIRVTLEFVIVSVPLKLAFALLIAILLYRNTRGMAFFRSVYYLPSLIGGSVAISIMWRNLFGYNGLVNNILHAFGIQGIDWISTPSTALYTLILLNVWQFGSSMVIFLAGLKQIPTELYEAASVDGATRLRNFFSITLPLLSPIILFNLVMNAIGSFQMFTQSFIVTQGGPANSTLVYALYLYEKAFTWFQMGYASAMAWILLIIVGVVTAAIFWSSRYWVYYEGGGTR